MNFLMKRLREPSTWSGLASVIAGASLLYPAAPLSQAAAVADAAAQAAGSGQGITGVLLTAAGAAAVIMRDPGSPR